MNEMETHTALMSVKICKILLKEIQQFELNLEVKFMSIDHIILVPIVFSEDIIFLKIDSTVKS